MKITFGVALGYLCRENEQGVGGGGDSGLDMEVDLNEMKISPP